ncbi:MULTISPECIES: hypothetical protein [unclassified Bartonella]|uniref:hypothetical protein n=1 Tax=unclassified Bartonella TaxID=2645622 RepID=UPI0035CF9E7F
MTLFGSLSSVNSVKEESSNSACNTFPMCRILSADKSDGVPPPYIDAADGPSKRANEISFGSDLCGKR